jgi:predicted GIY-YIG superfamily endonuclease
MGVDDILNNSDLFTGEKLSHKDMRHGRGIYFLYTSDDKLLYVGKSENIKHRIRQHLGGKDIATGKFIGFVSKIRVVFVDWDVTRQKLFSVERWFIGNLRPAFNGPIHESWADSYETFYGRLKEISEDLVGELINEWGRE